MIITLKVARYTFLVQKRQKIFQDNRIHIREGYVSPEKEEKLAAMQRVYGLVGGP